MKKVCFVILFLFVLSGLFSQTRPENRWLIGTWNSTFTDDGWSANLIYVFNDNGTGRYQEIRTRGNEKEEVNNEFLFSINQTVSGIGIVIYFVQNNIVKSVNSINIDRINDQRIVIDRNIFNKRN